MRSKANRIPDFADGVNCDRNPGRDEGRSPRERSDTRDQACRKLGWPGCRFAHPGYLLAFHARSASERAVSDYGDSVNCHDNPPDFRYAHPGYVCFSRRGEAVADMKTLRSTLVEMSADLLACTGIPFEETTELQRQLLASFAFGMIFAIGQIERLTPAEVHALSITMLTDAFGYSAEQAGAFSTHLIESASGTGNPTIQMVIHRGIDGHHQWSCGRAADLGENIKSVFQALGLP
jgi:hypothetical protein